MDYNRSLAYCKPEIAKEWHPTLNGDLKPRDVSFSSHKKVWWKCEKGHEWQTKINGRSNGLNCPYCSGKRVIVGETDLATKNPELVKEWHPTLNGDLKPSDVTAGSHKKVWWECEKGHKWQATIKHRTIAKSGCPYCAGRLPIVGETDLASRRPDLLKEWDYVKNIERPESFTVGSGKKVWWICSNGHSWEMEITKRTGANYMCPICSGRKVVKGLNDLLTEYPWVKDEWDYKKNKKNPEEYTSYSNAKVWWKCNAGHSWETRIHLRTKRNDGCPYCSGRRVIPGENDLVTQGFSVIDEWDYEKNKNNPAEYFAFSNDKVWWKCKQGHSWKAIIANRTYNKSGCPYCNGKLPIVGKTDLAYLHPELINEWDYKKNRKTPQQFTAHSKVKIWWICSNNHSWKAAIGERTHGSGCPICRRMQ